MINKFWLWWMPGFLAFPFIVVSPSLGLATMMTAILILVLLWLWSRRIIKRVLYVNDQIEKGVIFRKTITMSDQIQYRRKSMVLTHDTVTRYVRTRKYMSFALIFLSVYVVGYATYNWFKHPVEDRAMITIFNKEYWPQMAVATAVGAGFFLALTCLLAFLRFRYFESCILPPNEPRSKTEMTKEEKEEALEKARRNAGKSNGFISSVAMKTVSEDSEQLARENADKHDVKEGSIAAKARISVDDERSAMSRDQRIEADYHASEAAKKEAAGEAAPETPDQAD